MEDDAIYLQETETELLPLWNGPRILVVTYSFALFLIYFLTIQVAQDNKNNNLLVGRLRSTKYWFYSKCPYLNLVWIIRIHSFKRILKCSMFHCNLKFRTLLNFRELFLHHFECNFFTNPSHFYLFTIIFSYIFLAAKIKLFVFISIKYHFEINLKEEFRKTQI